MALKKADLRAILKNTDSTQEEQISEILNLLHEEVDVIKDERDTLRTENEELKRNSGDGTDWKAKYEAEHGAYETYKEEQTKAAMKAKKGDAYKALLKELGVAESAIGAVVNVTDLDSIELDDAGAIKNKETLTESVKTSWGGFITTNETGGASVPNPAGSGQGKKLEDMSMEEYIAARKKG